MEEAMPDDLQMARYADGDARAFEELFRRFEPRAYAYFVRRTGSLERAEDLYQALFLISCTGWSDTGVGAGLASRSGLALSVLCFGAVTSLFFGAVAAVVALGGKDRPPVRPLLPAAMLLLLLSPGVALQSIGTSWGVFLGWLLGTGGGAYPGVAGGIRFRTALTAYPSRHSEDAEGAGDS